MVTLLNMINGWATTPKSKTMGESPPTQDPWLIAFLYVNWEMQVVEFESGMSYFSSCLVTTWLLPARLLAHLWRYVFIYLYFLFLFCFDIVTKS